MVLRAGISLASIECLSCGRPSTVPSDHNEGCGREKLNNDPPSPDRLTHSILAKEGEGITQAIS